MNKLLVWAAVVILGASLAEAGNKPQIQSGTVISETSVACGSKKTKKTSVQLLCQEYVVRSGSADYHIRQLKPGDQALILVNTPIEFNLDKGKMKFKVNGKSYQCLVVSEAAASAVPATQSTEAPMP